MFNKIFNPIISTSIRNDREISDSRSFTKADTLKQSKIGVSLNENIKMEKYINVMHMALRPGSGFYLSEIPPPKTLNNLVKKPGLTGYHPERRLILKLILGFLKISYKGDLKLPGYFEQHPGDQSDGVRGALRELDRTFADIGGSFYSFKSTFYSIWSRKVSIHILNLNKLMHFFKFCNALTNTQRQIGVKAIQSYKVEKKIFNEHSLENKNEWDLITALQKIIMDQLGRYISLGEMSIMFKGRHYGYFKGIKGKGGTPKDSSFFSKYLYSTARQQKFSEEDLEELFEWISNPITWTYGIKSHYYEYSYQRNIKGYFKIQLSGSNLENAKKAIYQYTDSLRNQKKSLPFPPIPISNNWEIFEILWRGYSMHPRLNTFYGRKILDLDDVFKIIGERSTIRNALYRKTPFSTRILRHLFLKAHNDLFWVYAPNENAELLDALKNYSPNFWFVHQFSDQDMLRYYTEFEPKFEKYNRLSRTGIIPIPTVRSDQYPRDFKRNSFVAKEQNRILLRQWGYRNPYTGIPIPVDSRGYPLISITRHHYKISDPYNKLDCRIRALIPLPGDFHTPTGGVHSKQWEDRFSRAKHYIERGIAVIPRWWDLNHQVDYENWLKGKGFQYIFIRK